VTRVRRAAAALALAGALLLGATPGAEKSLYQIPGSWTDQDGNRFELGALRGNPVVIVLFYGTCDSVCPTVVRSVKKLDGMLSEADRARTRFVLVTIDPSVDTPEHLRAYADENGLDAARWRLLNGDPDQVRVLANALGIKYRAKGTGQYSHTVRVTLLDREGVVVDRVDGVEESVAPLAERIAGLLAQPPR
jgi:protein SCO1/2